MCGMMQMSLLAPESGREQQLQEQIFQRLRKTTSTLQSGLFGHVWKTRETPNGNSIMSLRALPNRKKNDFTSWPSPDACRRGGEYADPEKAALRREQGHQVNLSEAAQITHWPTPQTHDDKLRGNTEADNHYFPHDLSNAATLSSWQSPTVEDAGRMGSETDWPKYAQAGQTSGCRLRNQAYMASWPTPQAADVSRVEMNRLKHDRQTRDPNMPGSYRYELPDVARMASWSTPKAEDSECAGAHCGTADTLHSQANLATWATPTGRDYRNSGGENSHRDRDNPGLAKLAGWPTPMAGTPAQNGNNEAGNNDSSRKTVELAAWPSPCTPNGGRSMSTDKMDVTGKTLDGKKHTTTLEHAVKFAGPVRLTASGEMLTGSDAEMESSGQCQGQLNPALSAWLMGILPIWDIFCFRAGEAMRFRRSSKKAKKE